MSRNYIKVIFLCFSTLLLFGCGADKVTYEKGFPENDSMDIMQFMKDFTSSNSGNFLYMEDDLNIYSEINPNSDVVTQNYYKYSNGELKDYYQSVLGSESLDSEFKLLSSNATKDLFTTIKDESHNELPKIDMKKGNIIYIKTDKAENEFDLSELLSQYDVKASDNITFNIVALSDSGFQVDIENISSEDPLKKDISIFFKADLSDYIATQTFTDEFAKDMSNENLKNYKDLLLKLDSNERYLKSVSSYGILDTKEKEVKTVDESDYLSKDGKYVYINGNQRKLEDGVQKIQSIDNYFADNEDELEFEISFKKIAKEMGITTSGASTANIYYFNENFIVLGINYKGLPVGDVGYTNVLIDLKSDKKNPTAYIVNLDW